MHLQRITHKVFSATGTAIQAIENACVESWVVEPAARQRVEPSIYLESDLDRITGAIEFSTLDREMDSLKDEVREHAATVAYRLRDVDAVEGAIYSGRWKERLMTRERARTAGQPREWIANGVIACSYCGNHYFGHWITDDLTLYLAAQDIGEPYTLKRMPYLHEDGYRHLLNVSCKQVVYGHFDEAVVLRDFGQNAYKRKRYQLLRARIKEQFGPRGPRRVLLRRGNLGTKRDIGNDPEFESYLGTRGFSIVDPERLTPVEIVEQIFGAEIVMGVEGSQMPHALLSMADGGVLCCIQPPFRVANTIKGYTDCLGMRYAMLVGHAAPEGFRIDLNDLGRLLDKIETELARV